MKTTTATETMNADMMTATRAKTVESARARLAALGYVETCGRCGGSGHYSFNQINGTTCFGCSGSGKRLAKITKKIVAAAKVRVEAGELDGYFAKNAALAAAKRSLGAKSKACDEVYRTIGNLYTVASTSNATIEEIHTFVNESPLFKAQHLNNQISGVVFKITLAVQFRDRTDYVKCAAEMDECLAMLVALRDAYLVFVGG